MNSLVTYDSSSDEDDPLPQNLGSNEPENVSTKPKQAVVALVLEPKLDETPMVGPFIPSDTTQTYTEYEDGNEDADTPSSERDLIRFLTQASHPMTEMPPSPPGSPNSSAATKIKHFLDLKSKGVHFNEDLARKPIFKNPSLLGTLMDRAGLDSFAAYRTSLPTQVFEASSLPAAGYKEALLKSQQAIRTQEEAERKALTAAGKRTIEFASSGKSTSNSANSTPNKQRKRQRQ